MIFNIGLISVGAAIATNFFFGPAFYPNADIFWATVLTTIGSIIFVYGFWFWTITFPRAGGNYVFLSRSLNPGAGFSLSFVECCVSLIFGGLTSLFLVTTALAPFFGTMGVVTGAQWWTDAGAWMGEKNGLFITGTIALIVCAMLPVTGLRKYFTFQKILFVIAMAGTILGLIVLLNTSHSEFIAQFEATTGLDEAAVIAAAEESGWVPTTDTDWGQTFKFMVWPAAWILAGLYSIGFASEIRRVNRSQFIGMVGAVTLAGVLIAAYVPAVNNTVGHNLLGALAWNSAEAPEFSTPVAPHLPLVIALGSGSTAIGLIVGLAFVAWYLFLIPAQLIYSERVMMAWSFDGVMPAWLGAVSPRYRSPLPAIAVSLVAAIAFFALLVYGPLGRLVFVEGIVTVWVVALGVGIVFPWLKPGFFKQSPASQYYVGRFPLMSVVCVLGFAFGCFVLYLYFSDSLAAGHSATAIVPNLALLAGGIVTYLIAKSVRKSRGVDLELAFKELPIE
jgi:amino acid transporter